MTVRQSVEAARKHNRATEIGNRLEAVRWVAIQSPVTRAEPAARDVHKQTPTNPNDHRQGRHSHRQRREPASDVYGVWGSAPRSTLDLCRRTTHTTTPTTATTDTTSSTATPPAPSADAQAPTPSTTSLSCKTEEATPPITCGLPTAAATAAKDNAHALLTWQHGNTRDAKHSATTRFPPTFFWETPHCPRPNFGISQRKATSLD
jgi:hypothetical protein